jgi:hypothetical protein
LKQITPSSFEQKFRTPDLIVGQRGSTRVVENGGEIRCLPPRITESPSVRNITFRRR